MTLFAVGHSVTLLYGVLSGTHVNAYLVDAVIGFSVVYKALDNLGGSSAGSACSPTSAPRCWPSACSTASAWPPSCRTSRCRGPAWSPNIVAFNVGVEIGQLLALAAILIAMAYWRRTAAFARQAFAANVIVMTCGFVLMGYQLTGYFVS